VLGVVLGVKKGEQPCLPFNYWFVFLLSFCRTLRMRAIGGTLDRLWRRARGRRGTAAVAPLVGARVDVDGGWARWGRGHKIGCD
jgi:hypothetical protein